jgi:hypothetical protein
VPYARTPAFCCLLFLLTGLALTLPASPGTDALVLEVRDTRSRALLLSVHLPLDACFYLRYTHSTAKTEVEEHFKVVDEEEIVLDRMVYASGGAGIPDSPPAGATFRVADGRFVLDGLDKRFGSLERIRVAYFYPFILGTREAEYRLSDLARGQLVDIRARVRAWENDRRSQRYD